MVELPKQDQRWTLLAEAVQIHRVTIAFKAVQSSGLQQALGIATIAADTAHFAQLQQGHHPAEVAQHNRQRGRPAFSGLHLQNGRRANSGMH
jgi:hypothetical protein